MQQILRIACYSLQLTLSVAGSSPLLIHEHALVRRANLQRSSASKPVVTIPREVAAKLPKSGRARIIVLTPDDPEDALWRAGAYEQFVREDSPEDAVYDSY